MSTFELINASCADQVVDVVVNAANADLAYGGGICKVIFEKAGVSELTAECKKYKTPLCDGDAVITSACNMKNAKAIIHAVGPDFRIKKEAFKELYYAYYHSLEVLKENGFHSIAFPLISSGIFAGRMNHPAGESANQCIRAYKKFVERYPDYDIDVKLCAYKDLEMKEARLVCDKTFSEELTKKTEQPSGQVLNFSGETKTAIYFHKPEEPYGWLSNWYRSDFELDGIKYSSVEQYIMYQKCVLFGDEESARKVMGTDYPDAQQAIARNATGYIDCVWRGYRQIIVEKALMAKFSQNIDLMKMLLATGDAWLVECAHSDKNWACGISLYDDQRFDASNWLGMNILGFALMKVREDLKN